MYAIQINNSPRCLVHKTETVSNLRAVHNGRRWGGKWYGCVKTKQTTFETRESAERMIETLAGFTNLGHVFGQPLSFTIVEV